MSLIPASGSPSAREADAGVFVRVSEQFYSVKQVSGVQTPSQQLFTRGLASRNNATMPTIFGDTTTPAGSSFQTVGGRAVLQVVSGAGVLSRFDNGAGAAAFPVTQQFGGVDAIVGALANRPLRRYSISVPVRRTVAGTARLEHGLVTSSNFLTFAGVGQGIIFSCDPAVNGGLYVARYRQVAGGGITDVNLSISPAAWHKLEIRYTEGALPTIEWLIDDVPLRQVQGDASMPNFAGGMLWPGFCPGYGLSTPAGSTWQFGEGVFEVRDM